MFKNNWLKSNFTMVPNHAITDESLSPIEFRMLVYLASKPTGWEVYNKDIMKRVGIKTDHAIAKYWRSLVASGWVERETVREGGHVKYVSTTILNKSQTDDNPDCGNTTASCQGGHSNTLTLNNTNLLNNNKKNIIKKEFKYSNWKTDFNVYQEYLKTNFTNIGSDFIEMRRKEHPELDVIKTLVKIKDYWKKEKAWIKKKSSKTRMINWKNVFRNGFELEWNQVKREQTSVIDPLSTI